MLIKLVFLFVIKSFVLSQSIQINEVVSSNQSSYYDEDGETPDWIELFNPSTDTISISGWGLSDDVNEPFKWLIPNVSLGPQDFLLIMASDKDRVNIISEWETIIDVGDSWYYSVANQQPPLNWNQLGFNFSSWSIGPSGFGYGDGDDNTEIPNTISVYLIKPFSITNVEQIKKIAFHIDYDDGFVAYLNGQEFARDNIIGSPPAFDQGTITWREASMINGGAPSLFWVDSTDTWLNEGQNVLALQVHNFNSSSSDLSCIPFFSIGRDVTSGNVADIAEEIDIPISMLHSNFKISSEGETILITSIDGTIIDSLNTGQLQSDISIGRINDGQDYGMFLEPTPGESNGGEAVLGVLSDLIFSNESGFYSDSFISISINTYDDGASVHYTLDGSEPTVNSFLYISPVSIQENTVIKAASFKDGWLPSPIKTNTFIFEDQNNNLPAMFLSTDPDNFFDYNDGIYEMGPNASPDYPHFGANFWEDWEKPIFVEILETDNTYYSSPAGVKIFGGWSRGQAQKSLSLFARGQYSNNEFNYRFFPDLEIEKFQSLVLRNSGNDWNFTMLRDGYATGLFKDVDIDIQNYRPMLVYLNGEFWGLYNLREKLNEHFIASHHPVDPDEIDLIEVQNANQGTMNNYNELIGYLSQSNMADPAVYDSISKWIDVDNHINYNIAQIFIDNRDWPGNNIKFWRPQDIGGKWRWMLYDTDFSFGVPWMGLGYNFNTLQFAVEENGPDWPNPPWSTFLFRKLLENSNYQQRFINIFCDRFNTIFTSENMVNRLDSIATNIEDIIPVHQNKWPESANNWDYHVQIVRDFAQFRSEYMREYLESFFNLSNLTEAGFYSTPGGKIKINTIIPESNSWIGEYYTDIPIRVEAIPDTGFVFVGWLQYPDSGSIINVQIYEEFYLTAYFAPYLINDSVDLVINEINYNSSNMFDAGDWIEIYNNGNYEVDLDDYYFTDENPEHRYTFPEYSSIDPGEYILLVQDTASFSLLFPDVQNLYGPFDFGLSGSGEQISLYDVSDQLIDRVEYDDAPPWPVEPDGNGPTLELIHPDSSNENPSAWSFSSGNGSPGALNTIAEQLYISYNNIPSDHLLHTAFPNPFNSHVKFVFNVSENTNDYNLSIVNILGETVRTFNSQKFYNGINIVSWDGKNNFGRGLSTGVYFCRLKSKNIDNSIKLLYVK